MRIAELLGCGVSIVVDGRRWPLLITNGVLAVVERETGIDTLNSFGIRSATGTALLALLWAALAGAGAEYSKGELGAMITLRNLRIVRRQLLRAWVASMPEAREGPPRQEENDLTHLRAWALARFALQMSTDEWLDSTPRQIQALMDVRLEHLQWNELMIGILAAETVNHSFCRPEQARQPASFMIHPLGAVEAGGRLNSGEHILSQFIKAKGTKIVGYKGRRA